MTLVGNMPLIPAFQLGHPMTTPRLPFTACIPNERLDEKYRPGTLTDVRGQPDAVRQLRSFLAAPTSTAFLFEGSTGVGKTSAALALAHDLGVDRDWGFEEIKSARADMDAVDRALRMLRYVAPGSGWKLVLVDEADSMTPKASHLWLSALEDLPAKSVVIFTTNRPDHFPDRFLDRCERVRFGCDGRSLASAAQDVIDAVWMGETGSMDDAPNVDDLPNLLSSDGSISFRRAVMALGPKLRDRANQTEPPAVAPPSPIEPPAPMPVTPPLGPLSPLATSEPPKPRPKPPATPARTPLDRPMILKFTAKRDLVARPPAPREPTRDDYETAPDPPVYIPPESTAPSDTLSVAGDLANRRADAAREAKRRLEDESAANLALTREIRERVRWDGDDATDADRAALRASELTDKRLVKEWLDASTELGRAMADANRAMRDAKAKRRTK